MTTTDPKPSPPGTFIHDLRAWFDAHPGWHAPKDVAAAMTVPTHTVAARCGYLSNRGLLLRRQRKVGRAKKSVYAAPGTTE